MTEEERIPAGDSPYAGRWVARLRGRIVAHGGTPDQARRLAQAGRHKEKVEVFYQPMAEPLTLSPLLDAVRPALPAGQPVYLVGGAVRDALLARPTHDLDFAVPADGIRLARRVADALGAAFMPLDESRDTGRVIRIHADGSRAILDFASYRGPDLEADLRGRDFTVNALALDVHTLALHDPLGGAADLRAKVLRPCSSESLRDDPLRVLRAVRLAAELGLHIPAATRRLIRQAVPGLPEVSPERLRDELLHILGGSRPSACLRALDLLDVLPHLLPELVPLKGLLQPAPHIHDAWEHTLRLLVHLEIILAALRPEYDPQAAADLFSGLLVLQLGRYREQFGRRLGDGFVPGRSLRPLLFLAGLYHDVAKPQTRSEESGRLRFLDHDRQGAPLAVARSRALMLSSQETGYLETLVRHHMRVHFFTNRLVKEDKLPSRRAIYRFYRDTGPAGVDLVLLALADLRATYEQTLPQAHWAACLRVGRLLLENWWEKPDEAVSPPRLLGGRDLMDAFGLGPGPLIGELLEAVREAQAAGRIETREEALAFVGQKLAGGREAGEKT
jgi:hypothetical protein